MMLVEHVRTLFEYNADAHRRLWECALALSDEDYIKPLTYSHGAIRSQFVHVLSTDRRWFARITGEPLPEQLVPEQFGQRETFWQLWLESEAKHRRIVSGFDEATLARIIEYDMPHRGGMKRNTVLEILAHVVNHGTDHRAQILAMLFSLGAPTFEQDLMMYLWRRSS